MGRAETAADAVGEALFLADVSEQPGSRPTAEDAVQHHDGDVVGAQPIQSEVAEIERGLHRVRAVDQEDLLFRNRGRYREYGRFGCCHLRIALPARQHLVELGCNLRRGDIA